MSLKFAAILSWPTAFNQIAAKTIKNGNDTLF